MDQSKFVIDLSLDLLEAVAALDFSSLQKDRKAFVLSQLSKTVGELGNVILKNE